MSLYSIKDTTLTAIGDAIRQKAGGEITRFETDYFEAKGESAVVPAGGDTYLYYTFPGAATITIGLTNIVKPKEGIIRMGGGRVTNGNSTTLPFKISGSTTEDFDTFSNCDGVVTLRCSDAEGTYSFDVWMYGYDETGDFVTGVWETVTYKNYKPTEMPDAILSIQGGGSGGFTPAGQIDITANGNYDIAEYASAQVDVPVGVFPAGTLEITKNGSHDVTSYASAFVNVPTGGVEVPAVVLSGNASYACANAFAAAYMENFPEKISTNNLSGSASSMFQATTVKEVPFDLNFSVYATSVDCNMMFNSASNLEKLPKINNLSPSGMESMFNNCRQLRDASALSAINMSTFESGSYNSASQVFYNCYSLRSIPSSFLKGLGRCKYSSYFGSPYNNMFYKCMNLDEIVDLGVSPTAFTSNMFGDNPLYSCCALRRFTFETNEDGTPKTVNWKNQVITFTGYVGWGILGMYGGTYEYMNSGRSYANLINDAADYAEKKNHPDRIAVDTSEQYSLPYATYNKASAIETIQSLPDCSASGGTNTIKFKGDAGSATDEGAIRDMEQQYIDLAASKGWIVTFE